MPSGRCPFRFWVQKPYSRSLRINDVLHLLWTPRRALRLAARSIIPSAGKGLKRGAVCMVDADFPKSPIDLSSKGMPEVVPVPGGKFQ